MARFRHIQNSFRGGEVSPNMFGRTDLESYQHSAEEIKNMIVKSQGGARRRPGTQFIADKAVQYKLTDGAVLNGGTPDVFNSTTQVVPFIFSRDEAYALLFKPDGASSAISIINVDTLANGTFSVGTFTNTAPYSTFESFSGYTSPTTEVANNQYSQSGDVLFVVNPGHSPYVIIRTAVDTFERRALWDVANITGFDTAQLERAFPYLPVNIDTGHTMTISALGTTLTSSKAFFNTSHVGAIFKVNNGAGVIDSFWATGYTSTTVLTGFSSFVPGVSFGSSLWEESAFSPFQGWPRSVSFHEQRIYYGGTVKNSDTVYGSEIGDIFEMDGYGFPADTGFGTVANSDAFSFSVASFQVNEIQWLSSGKVLNIGTLSREYIASGSSGALGPLDIAISSETSHGSSFRQPVRLENVLVFVGRASFKLREFVFNRDQDSYVADDLTRFVDHFLLRTRTLSGATTEPTISKVVKQEAEDTIIWVLDSAGGLYGLTRDRFMGTSAWHYHILGGNLSGNIPKIQSIISLPSADAINDDLWMIVQRTIDGSPAFYIERMNKEYGDIPGSSAPAIALNNMIYVDSAYYFYTGSAFTVITGLDHLEGETVQVVADDQYVGEFTVASNQITLTNPATEAIVGLKYTSQIKTLRLEDGSTIGTAQTAIKRIDQVAFRFHRTIGGEFGSDEDNLEEIPFRKLPFVPSDPIPLFTGDKISEMPSSPDRKGQIIIRQDLPLPQGVVAIVARGIVYD